MVCKHDEMIGPPMYSI